LRAKTAAGFRSRRGRCHEPTPVTPDYAPFASYKTAGVHCGHRRCGGVKGCPPVNGAWAAAGPAQGRVERGRLAADTAAMAKKPEPLFGLTYRHSDGSAAGVVIVESRGLLHARLKASLAGADRELEFASGHQLDPVSAEQIPGEHDRPVSR
jgi:hypothetical protein